jgi:hypothetical protein
MSRLDLTTARCEALFASSLQPSQRPDAAQIQVAIMLAVRSYGSRGCAARVAQEFGDHPDTAPARMRWARDQVTGLAGGGAGAVVRARAAAPVALAA